MELTYKSNRKSMLMAGVWWWKGQDPEVHCVPQHWARFTVISHLWAWSCDISCTHFWPIAQLNADFICKFTFAYKCACPQFSASCHVKSLRAYKRKTTANLLKKCKVSCSIIATIQSVLGSDDRQLISMLLKCILAVSLFFLVFSPKSHFSCAETVELKFRMKYFTQIHHFCG